MTPRLGRETGADESTADVIVDARCRVASTGSLGKPNCAASTPWRSSAGGRPRFRSWAESTMMRVVTEVELDYSDFLRRRHGPAHSRRTAEGWAAFLLPHLRPEMLVLDIGCGPGSITVGLTGQVIGLDLAPISIEGVLVVGASGSALPFASSSFDGIYLNAVLQHVGDPGAVLREARRVAKPGAVIGIGDADWGTRVIHPHDSRMARGQQIQEAARTSGNVRIGQRASGAADRGRLRQRHYRGAGPGRSRQTLLSATWACSRAHGPAPRGSCLRHPPRHLRCRRDGTHRRRLEEVVFPRIGVFDRCLVHRHRLGQSRVTGHRATPRRTAGTIARRRWELCSALLGPDCGALPLPVVVVTGGEVGRCIVVVENRSKGSGQVDDDGDRLSDLRQRQRSDVAECVDDPCR